MKIGKINIDRPLFLAPMEGVTDLPFRVICKRMGAGLVYTEFIASEALIRNVKRSIEKMRLLDEERPVSVQIFGDKIDSMIESAKICEDTGADIVDINFGCWVKKVVNNNAGAAFLKEPERLADMAEKVAQSITIPLTVKTRIGWDKNSIKILKVTELLNDTKVAAFAVHCRTREQGMKGDADWSWLPRVKEIAKMPVILNGDILTASDVKRAFEETGCDAVMVARGAIGNPFIFKNAVKLLDTGILQEEPSPEERIETCLEHLRLTIEYKGFPRGLHEFRKHYSGYLKGLYNNSSVRQEVVVMESYEEIESRLMDYTEELSQELQLA
ncbi:MAG: tRNA dihydrouridine synthase DusB [Ignavibacteriae bacterium]|nr:tRNA dihydrouridine synthase DusB [Ignavibacteriota bacterium]